MKTELPWGTTVLLDPALELGAFDVELCRGGALELGEFKESANISFCAPFGNPHLLLYAGDLWFPSRSYPVTLILLPSS